MEVEPNNFETRRGRVDRLVKDMVRLHKFGFEAIQSAEYEATAQEYMQAQVDLRYPDDPEGTHSHYITG